MILQSLDRIVSASFPDAHVRLTVANVTDTARTLERNHLCGPIAGLVQAEFVGGAALLGTLLDAPGQTASLRVRLPEGQLGGVTVECAYGYGIRGYTRQKVLPQLDDSGEPDETLFDRAIGRSAHCAVVRSDARRVVSEARFDLSFADRLMVTDIVEEYFRSSLQRRALVQLSAASKLGYVECAHAVLCDFLPEASADGYDRMERFFDDGSAQDALDAGADLAAFARLFGLGAPEGETVRSVRFFCPCTAERVLAMLHALPRADLLEMAAAGHPADIFCHMCGKCYTITPEQLRTLL